MLLHSFIWAKIGGFRRTEVPAGLYPAQLALGMLQVSLLVL